MKKPRLTKKMVERLNSYYSYIDGHISVDAPFEETGNRQFADEVEKAHEWLGNLIVWYFEKQAKRT